jgi:CheY-like chemotaxis protein
VEVVSAISSDAALAVLESDNDFDLILSDVQRDDETYKATGGVRIHGGVNFVVVLRRHQDPVIRSLPVIFYAAYEWERLVTFTRPARELQPEAEMANGVSDLLPKTVRRLVEMRSRPILAKAKKEATRARDGDGEAVG